MIRLATEADLPAMNEFCGSHAEFVRSSVDAEHCYLSETNSEVTGLAVLNNSFFGCGFVALLVVRQTHRRGGIGEALMKFLPGVCEQPKLFTSTNLSNLPMQSLLAKLDWQLSGVIHNLDPGDPELVYYLPGRV